MEIDFLNFCGRFWGAGHFLKRRASSLDPFWKRWPRACTGHAVWPAPWGEEAQSVILSQIKRMPLPGLLLFTLKDEHRDSEIEICTWHNNASGGASGQLEHQRVLRAGVCVCERNLGRLGGAKYFQTLMRNKYESQISRLCFQQNLQMD